METEGYFADAETDFKEARFVIFGIPYDKTASFRRGAKEAPSSIREASWNFETYNMKTGLDFRDIPVHDFGDISTSNNDSPVEMINKVKDLSNKVVVEGKTPVGIGGEHTITIGITSTLPSDTMVISFDAHLDFRDKYQGEPYSHACVMRRLADHITADNIVVIGVRSAEKRELLEAKREGLRYYDAFTIFNKGLNWVLEELMEEITGRKIYLTIDIDVVDPAYAPGTGTPEPFGLKPIEVLMFIERIAPWIIGFDLVEVCPPFDNGETSILAARLIRSTIEMIWLKRKD